MDYKYVVAWLLTIITAFVFGKVYARRTQLEPRDTKADPGVQRGPGMSQQAGLAPDFYSPYCREEQLLSRPDTAVPSQRVAAKQPVENAGPSLRRLGTGSSISLEDAALPSGLLDDDAKANGMSRKGESPFQQVTAGLPPPLGQMTAVGSRGVSGQPTGADTGEAYAQRPIQRGTGHTHAGAAPLGQNQVSSMLQDKRPTLGLGLSGPFLGAGSNLTAGGQTSVSVADGWPDILASSPAALRVGPTAVPQPIPNVADGWPDAMQALRSLISPLGTGLPVAAGAMAGPQGQGQQQHGQQAAAAYSGVHMGTEMPPQMGMLPGTTGPGTTDSNLLWEVGQLRFVNTHPPSGAGFGFIKRPQKMAGAAAHGAVAGQATGEADGQGQRPAEPVGHGHGDRDRDRDVRSLYFSVADMLHPERAHSLSRGESLLYVVLTPGDPSVPVTITVPGQGPSSGAVVHGVGPAGQAVWHGPTGQQHEHQPTVQLIVHRHASRPKAVAVQPAPPSNVFGSSGPGVGSITTSSAKQARQAPGHAASQQQAGQRAGTGVMQSVIQAAKPSAPATASQPAPGQAVSTQAEEQPEPQATNAPQALAQAQAQEGEGEQWETVVPRRRAGSLTGILSHQANGGRPGAAHTGTAARPGRAGAPPHAHPHTRSPSPSPAVRHHEPGAVGAGHEVPATTDASSVGPAAAGVPGRPRGDSASSGQGPSAGPGSVHTDGSTRPETWPALPSPPLTSTSPGTSLHKGSWAQVVQKPSGPGQAAVPAKTTQAEQQATHGAQASPASQSGPAHAITSGPQAGEAFKPVPAQPVQPAVPIPVLVQALLSAASGRGGLSSLGVLPMQAQPTAPFGSIGFGSGSAQGQGRDRAMTGGFGSGPQQKIQQTAPASTAGLPSQQWDAQTEQQLRALCSQSIPMAVGLGSAGQPTRAGQPQQSMPPLPPMPQVRVPAGLLGPGFPVSRAPHLAGPRPGAQTMGQGSGPIQSQQPPQPAQSRQPPYGPQDALMSGWAAMTPWGAEGIQLEPLQGFGGGPAGPGTAEPGSRQPGGGPQSGGRHTGQPHGPRQQQMAHGPATTGGAPGQRR